MQLLHNTLNIYTADQTTVSPERKRLDLTLSFFTGPAQVPMMSPNGSVPPIYVPPGYVSQVLILYYFQCSVADWQLVELNTALISAFPCACLFSRRS